MIGEHGSIDLLGLRPADRSVVVVEVKTDIASSEAIGRKLDEKALLAPQIVLERWRWTPTSVGRLVVMPCSMRLRRLVERHEVIGRMFPANAIAIRRWFATSFWSDVGAVVHLRYPPQESTRRRRAPIWVNHPGPSVDPAADGIMRHESAETDPIDSPGD